MSTHTFQIRQLLTQNTAKFKTVLISYKGYQTQVEPDSWKIKAKRDTFLSKFWCIIFAKGTDSKELLAIFSKTIALIVQKSPSNQKFSELLLISCHGIHHEKKDWESENQNKKVKKNIKVTHSKLKNMFLRYVKPSTNFINWLTIFRLSLIIM